MRLAVLLCTLLASPALAQVSVNQGALDQLHPAAPAARPAAPPATATATPPGTARPRPAARPAPRSTPHPTTPAAARPGTPVKPPRFGPSHPVTIAPAAPPAAVLQPPPPPPPVPAQPAPPPVPVVTNAVGEVSPLPNGVRVTFGGGKADLNAATLQAIQALARTLRDKPGADITLYAYAAGVPDDPSTPRRLSLSRALAVRAVLISEGIASTRIYPRALGAPADGPADRLDATSGPPAGPPPGAIGQ